MTLLQKLRSSTGFYTDPMIRIGLCYLLRGLFWNLWQKFQLSMRINPKASAIRCLYLSRLEMDHVHPPGIKKTPKVAVAVGVSQLRIWLMGLLVFVADKMLFLKTWLCSWDQVIPISIPITLILIIPIHIDFVSICFRLCWSFIGGLALCNSWFCYEKLWLMTLWFISIPDVQNMTNLVNPVGKIEKTSSRRDNVPCFRGVHWFPNLGLIWAFDWGRVQSMCYIWSLHTTCHC